MEKYFRRRQLGNETEAAGPSDYFIIRKTEARPEGEKAGSKLTAK